MTEIRVLVGTKSFDGASAFYRDTLGFETIAHWDDPDGRGTLYRASTDGVLEIVEDSPHHPAGTPSGVTVAIEVDDADTMYERVRSAGVEIVEPLGDRPWGHRNFEIRDPNGLSLVFFTVMNADDRAEER
jgi:uncharacterized glyoxalase superfamily protein PhnB